MIFITDNLLSEEVFSDLQDYCKQDFSIVTIGDKDFSVLDTPPSILPFLEIEGHEIVLSFIRSAHNTFDTDLRIHNDGYINGHKTSFASILYVSGNEVSKNGTSFWSHSKYGKKAAENQTEEEYDKLLLEDSNNIDVWEQRDIVVSEPNRFLVYNSQYFHSKFPQIIEEGIRKVCVCFYRKK